MKWFFSTLPRNIIGCFKGRMVLWHLLAIGVTVVCVLSGFDWQYYLATRSPVLWRWMIPSAPIGMFLPILLPLGLLIVGAIIEHPRTVGVGWAIGQAELMGS